MLDHYRGSLQAVVSASAAPYGYTLTIWTSGAITSHAQGVPTTLDAILLLGGAALGFLGVAITAFGRLQGVLSPPQYAIRAWGGLHVPSVGLAIAAAALLAHFALPEWVTWLTVGFVGTALYLFVIALQFLLATRRGTRDST